MKREQEEEDLKLHKQFENRPKKQYSVKLHRLCTRAGGVSGSPGGDGVGRGARRALSLSGTVTEGETAGGRGTREVAPWSMLLIKL